jgi:hypothetical protein
MYTLFILALLGLCVSTLAAFIIAFRRRSLALVLFVPMIAACGSAIYFSYVAVLGYPAKLEWNELPNRITVIYFRVQEEESITLWLLERERTRLVELPYREGARSALEGERMVMGRGIPTTFVDQGGGGKGKGKGRGRGKGKKGNGEEGEGHGWRYRIESYGEGVPFGSMPPKVN